MKINKAKIDKIKGFLDEREANYLYKLALKLAKFHLAGNQQLLR